MEKSDINLSNPIRLVDYDIESSTDSESSGDEECPNNMSGKSCHNATIATNNCDNDTERVVQNQLKVKSECGECRNGNTTHCCASKDITSLNNNTLLSAASTIRVEGAHTMSYSLSSPESVSVNVKTESTQHKSDDQPSVSDEHEWVNTIPLDLLRVLSLVEDDAKFFRLSNTPTRDQQPSETTVGKEESRSTVESDSSDDNLSSSSESSSDESDIDSESVGEEDEEDVAISNMAKRGKRNVIGHPPRPKGVLIFRNLPAVVPPDLCIHESVELSPLGEIECMIRDDALVIIKSFENVPAVDADSMLFLEDRSCFGRVFDIFGRVSSPHYCVRFNSEEEIMSANIEIGQTVYFAPKMTELTNFVFLSQLNSIRGSDASWEDDQEPPGEVVEYSDDECESRGKATRRRANRLNKPNETRPREQGATGCATKGKRLKPRKSSRRKHNGQFIPAGNQVAGPPVNAQQCQQTGTIFPSALPQGCGFTPPPNQQRSQVIHLPEKEHPPLRIPYASTLYSGGPHPACRLGGPREPFPPPLMDVHPYQPNLGPSFPGESQQRNFLIHQGRPYLPQPLVTQMSQSFEPPPPNGGEVVSPPPQQFAQSVSPYQQN